MTRQMSQQQSGQSASHHGTPQMVQGTPIMNQAIPARNMTPQPRINQQGSPSVGIQGTPGMMQTPQANLTPEMQLMLRQQQIARFQATQQAGMQKSPEQIAMFRAQQQINQLGVPANQNPQVYQQALARQIQQQMANSSSPITSTSPQNAGQMRPTASQQGFPVPGQGSLANADSATLRATYNAHRQTLMQRYPGLVNVPQNMAQGMRQLENAIRLAEAREHAGGQAGGMGQPGINGMNMGGQQPSAQQAAIQYQRMLQQQQQRVQTAQQQQQQQQLMAQMRGQQPGMQGMGMNGMGNIQQNQLMQGGMNMGNMQGMQGMQGMGGIGGMNMQNMQNIQMQMAAMQRQQAGQQRRGNEGMGDWSGV
jgi:transcription factor SPT20